MVQIKSNHWDIFCSVVDNYGDIGVCWRLAKQLANEYQIEVVLWVDDLASFNTIQPEVDLAATTQQLKGITVNLWREPLPVTYIPGQVLIEAFACQLPAEVIQQLVDLKQCGQGQPCWLNLEYLSAEAWVDDCHALPSLQANGLNKSFYFPGFSRKTGGLLCEADLFTQRDVWQADSGNRLALFAKLGIEHCLDSDRFISVFSYETAALQALCDYWQHSATPIRLLVPLGRSLNSFVKFFNLDNHQFCAGEHWQKGNLHLHVLPLTDQIGFDRLLWSCDVNIVRGEDSFLRAQWAAKPFIWHIYPQDEDYHLVKLDALMQRYCANLDPTAAQAWQQLSLNFNRDQQKASVESWQHYVDAEEKLNKHAKIWPISAIDDEDLATRLVHFVKNS
ncbi:elongation factor P maturation arginine rhamnosyltransferase EarP [Shewanella waksmanii]|uniref:elongation factor P maturation arginine rhamnosyltransferase EarP n=1 Tax=Shewanella waksmanii TaxID=213783 RepID=UPI0012FAAD32|nr:elongation factor P maturation arginine rhamnosyltransferase EarP [Shewanella waksmanii]